MVISLVFALPGVILNGPIGILLRVLAEKERLKVIFY